MKITVVGVGYVGLSNAVLFSQRHEVMALDINEKFIDQLNHKVSHIKDPEIEDFLANKDLNLKGTTSKEEAYDGTDLVLIATPTNYDEETNYFDTSAVESVIEDALYYAPGKPVIIKSTIPVGFTKEMQEKYGTDLISFSPEFLREGKALYDNLHPSRIIVGATNEDAKVFGDLLKEGSLEEDTPVIYMDSTEAEAAKLFANTYLAMRVAFFNELDTYAEMKNLDTNCIIQGVSLDPRIGMYYNNPSFGYGGYCLPKDSKQLLANFKGVPQNLIQAIVDSNATRKQHIADQVLSCDPKQVGIYRLTMKTGSDNFRESAIQSVMTILEEAGVNLVIYEPTLEQDEFEGYKVIHDLDEFKAESDAIITNRFNEELEDVEPKVYTRDVFHNN